MRALGSILVLVIATAMAFEPTAAAATRLPLAATPVASLSPQGLEHREVLRIQRDFGKAQWEIVLDSWVESGDTSRLSDVRMWWLKTDSADRRSPFSRRVSRYLEIVYTPKRADAWKVRITGDRKEFQFDVEIDARGRAHAFTTVVTDAGDRVEHCLATDAKLVARRFLGIPVGIRQLQVTCTDASGSEHVGPLVHRKVNRGLLYSADDA